MEHRASETRLFLSAYTTATPGIIDAVLSTARLAGIHEAVESSLNFMESYFNQSVDFIPDHLGLLGLLDDCYLAQRILQAISDDHRRTTGRQVLSVDLTPANTIVRVLIGEPTATGLDDAITDALNRREIADLFQRLAQLESRLPVLVPVAYPPFELEDQDRVIKLGVLGGAN